MSNKEILQKLAEENGWNNWEEFCQNGQRITLVLEKTVHKALDMARIQGRKDRLIWTKKIKRQGSSVGRARD